MIVPSLRLLGAITLAVALSISHWYAYDHGRGAVQAKWDRETARQIQVALKAEQAARAREQTLAQENARLERRHADEKRKAAAAAASASAELDRLRDQIRAAGSRAACPDPAASGRTHGGAVFQELLGECAGALLELGKEADRLKGIAGGLQDYARNVCRN